MVKLRSLAVGVMAASLVTLGTSSAIATPRHVDNPRPVPVQQSCTPRVVHTFDTPRVRPTDEVTPRVTSTDSTDLRDSLRLRTIEPSRTITPRPTINPQRCAPERFVVQLTQLGSAVVQNRVIASGPVFGTGSDDLAASTNTFDRFNLPAFFRSVNVRHTGIGTPTVNLALCVASINQLGRWSFNGGQGLFRNAIGNGNYLLTGQWVFPTLRDGTCSLRLIRGNPLLQNRIQPRYTNLQVWATGLARR